MADKLKPNQGFSKRQPCLDFIETRLPEYHEAFRTPHVRFNTVLGRYLPIPQVNKYSKSMKDQEDCQQLELLPDLTKSDSTRRPFWEEMLPQALSELKSLRDEPEKLVGTPNSIRELAGWVEIVNVLEVARAKYYNYSGFVGFWKRTERRLADHAGDGKRLLSLLPKMEYTSLIHCVFDVIFDAAKRTAEIRSEVEDSLRRFREKLEDVENVVAVYETEEGITSAALKVIVSVLQAIEDIVDYYSAKKRRTAAKALWKGGDHQGDLSECLREIDSSCKRLIEKASISNFRETKSANVKASEGLERLKELQLGQLKILAEQKRLADAQVQIAASSRSMGINQAKLAAGLSREVSANERNAAANEKNAMISAAALNAFYRLSDEYLLAISEKERVQRLNNQLLVSNAQLSFALRAERSRSRSRSPLPAPEAISQGQLLRILNTPNVEEKDMEYISDSAALVGRRDQGRAEHLVANPRFRQWVVQTRSTELLVHGHMKPSRTSVSALSLFSAAIVRNLRTVSRFRTVAFFCGQHYDSDDPLTGGIGIIKSLISQLLHQHRFDSAELARVAREVNLRLLGSGVDDVEQLCRLFVSLVRRLRSNVTLFCVLDSVNVYEDPEYMQEMHVDKVLLKVLSLTQDSRVQTHVKILLTSPTDTDTIRAAFDEDDILSMAGEPKRDKHFDDGRFAQQVEGALNSRRY